MKKILVIVSFMIMLFANEEIILFSTTKSVSPKDIENVFKKNGYSIQQNRDMNRPFIKQFKKTDFTIYNLLTIYYPKITIELVKQNPDAGIFAPFSIAIYQKKGDKKLYAAVLNANAKAKILGMKFDNKLLNELEKINIKTLKEALPGAKRENLSYKPKKIKEALVTKYSFEVEDEEALDIKDEVEMVIEDGLKPIGFVMANFNDFNYDLKEAGIDDFIFYDTYSLCKLKVIYNVAKIRPEAGVFAPCTMAIYQKKGSNSMKIVFPNIFNWISTLNIDDPKIIDILKKAQKDMINVIENSIP